MRGKLGHFGCSAGLTSYRFSFRKGGGDKGKWGTPKCSVILVSPAQKAWPCPLPSCEVILNETNRTKPCFIPTGMLNSIQQGPVSRKIAGSPEFCMSSAR
jgi:hypothetical protein